MFKEYLEDVGEMLLIMAVLVFVFSPLFVLVAVRIGILPIWSLFWILIWFFTMPLWIKVFDKL